MDVLAHGQTATGAVRVERHSEVLYRVCDPGGVRGYVERVGRVWVTLAGSRRDTCVEVGQSATLERATALLSAP